MGKIKILFILLSFLFAFNACSDNDDNNNGGTTREKVDKQIEAVVKSLSGNESVNIFTAALSGLNTSSISFENENLTLFAFTNEAITNEISPKADMSPAQKYLTHHIASGFFNLDNLKGMSQIKLLDGTTADIMVNNGTVYINGVELKSPQQVSNSLVYIIDKIIPQTSSNAKLITFSISEVNEDWSESSAEEGFPSKEAEITIYEDEFFKSIKTDNNGIASLTIDPTKNYTFSVKKEDMKDLYFGWVITGIFTTQEQINNAPDYGNLKKELGALMFQDTNGDGVISDEDKIEKRKLDTGSATIQVFIAEEDNMFAEPEITDEHMKSLAATYKLVKNQYMLIDNTYSTMESRQSITPGNNTLKKFWADSYAAIRITNILLQSPKDTPDQTEKKSLIKKYRADLHYYLAIVFGNISLADRKWDYGDTPLAQVSFDEVLDFVKNELSETLTHLSNEDRIESLQLSALVSMHKKTNAEYVIARRYINQAINLSENEDYVNYTLSAECAIEAGTITQALYDTNVVLEFYNKPQLPPSVSTEELRSTIYGLYDLFSDTGLKYPNIIRWGKNAAWGKYSLMPIDPNEIDASGGNIKQNPGW